MRVSTVVSVTTSGVLVACLLAGCSGGDIQVEATSVGPVPSQEAVSPSPSLVPEASLPAGVPSVEPSLWEEPQLGLAGASALITIATKDPDTDGLLVGGYVTGVMEDGGECHFVVTAASGEVVDLLKSGVENNGSTSCGSATVPLSQLGTGPFTVVMRYVNSLGEVASEAVEVEIP